MPTAISHGFRRVVGRLSPEPSPDGELLARFLATRDHDAFAAVVRRHAAMVLGTCRRLLGSADADDALQATFLVLLRKAPALTDRVCVGTFLYGVAFHTAQKAKAMAATRRTKEARARLPEPAPDRSEVLRALDEELARLPEKYRAPVVLCELEGRSRRDAAAALGVPEGTISSRLSTAHRMLEKRLRSRGFAASVALVLADQAVAGTDARVDRVVRVALEPSQTASLLATEMMKMTLLSKIGLSSAFLAALLVGLATAVPTSRAAPEDRPEAGPRFVAAPVPAVPEPAWKAEFRKAYGLKDGEVLRRVPPPYPKCRAEYFRDLTRAAYKRSKLEVPEEEANRDYSDHFTKFGWADGWAVDRLRACIVPVEPEVGGTLLQVATMTTGFPHTRVEGDDALLEQKVTGDFVVRAGADPEKVAAALEKVLRKECERSVSLAIKEVERKAYVLSGKWDAKPLPDRKEHEIEVYGFELTDRAVGGGGTGDLATMVAHTEGFINVPIVLGKIEGAPKRVEWHYNARSPFTEAQRAQDTDPESVMRNLAAQTGLTVVSEKRAIKVLVVRKGE